MDEWKVLWSLGLVPPARLGRWLASGRSLTQVLDDERERDGGLPELLAQALDKHDGRLESLLAVGDKRLARDLGRVPLPAVEVRSASDAAVLAAAGSASPFGVVAGAGDLPSLPRLAVVGTRGLSGDDEAMVREWLGALFGSLPVALVSGGAFGVDTLAHRAALEAERPVILVLAGGLMHAGPAPNREDFRRVVAAGGTVLSDRPPAEAVFRASFVDRNRLIASIADAVLVVRAPMRSGALGTARAARALGRTVMAVPGAPGDELAAGCHWLIRTGARLVTGWREVAEELGGVSGQTQERLPLPPQQDPPADAAERAVWAALGKGRAQVDGLLRAVDDQPGEIHRALLMLEVAGRVKVAPGGWVERLW